VQVEAQLFDSNTEVHDLMTRFAYIISDHKIMHHLFLQML
jgi:hypothetical protein